MSVAAALLVLAAVVGAWLLIRPAVRRTDLGVWHPAVPWLALHVVFFGVGSAALALDGRPGPALYVGGAIMVFAVAVAGSDRLARRRMGPDAISGELGVEDPAPLRAAVVVGLAMVGVGLIAPTLLRVGLPFLAGDITGARTELAGLPVQVLRVTLPALALALALGRSGWPAIDASRHRSMTWLTVGAIVALEIALASRYLVAELLAVGLLGLGLAARHPARGRMAALALVAVVAFGGIQVLRAYDQAAGRELAFAVERTVNRVILIQPRTLEALQTVIPAEQPYFGGSTWLRRLGPALDRPDIPNLGYWIYARLFPGQEPPGYAAPGLIGEAWANFGPLGLALFAPLGVAAERLGAILRRRRRATADLVAGALLVVFVARTHALGLNGLAVLVGLVLVWRVLSAGGLDGTWRAIREVIAWRI